MVRGVGVIGVTNDFFVPNQLHYITVWVRCQRVDQNQEPQVSCLPTYLPLPTFNFNCLVRPVLLLVVVVCY